MREFIVRNKYLLLLFVSWYLVSFAISGAASVLILGSLYFFKRDNNYKAMFLGLITIIFMSDSRQAQLAYTSDLKVVYVVLLIVFMFFDKKRFMPFSDYYKPFLLFFLFSVPLVFLNPAPLISFQKTISYNLIFFIVPNYFLSSYKEEGDLFIKDIISFLCLFLLISLILIPFSSENLLFIEGRYNGLLGNPNGIGVFVSILYVFFFIADELFPNLFFRQDKILIILSVLISAVLCGSRNSIVTIMIFYFSSKLFKYSIVFGFISILFIGLLRDEIGNFLLFAIDSFGLKEFYRVDDVEKGSGRLIAWIFGWEKVQENFFFGQGFNYTNYLYGQFFEKLSRLGHQGNAHNSYLTLWLDTGLIGLFLVLRGLFLSFIRVFNVSPLFLSALLSILFSMFFESWFAASLNPFTFQVVCITLIGIIYKQKHELEKGLTVT
jgi:O-antigen ligase